MKIEISTEFETSYSDNYHTKIIARIVNDKGVTLCEGEDNDYHGRRASAKSATRIALDKFERMLKNARDVAEKSGLQ